MPNRRALYARSLAGRKLLFFYDLTDILYVCQPGDKISAEFAFSLSVRLRKSFHQEPDIGEHRWAGGLIIVGNSTDDCVGINRHPPFDRITGLEVVPIPFGLVDVLQALEQSRPLYPDQWDVAWHGLDGLNNFWDKSQQILIQLDDHKRQEAIAFLYGLLYEALRDRDLERLIAHRIRGELQKIFQDFGEVARRSDFELKHLTLHMQQLMSQYQSANCI